MKHVIYTMQFKGGMAPAGDGVLKTTTIATSCSIQSLTGPEGLAGTFHALEGGFAWLESEVRLTGKHSFTESGAISFGEDDHMVRFSSMGEGHMGPSADEKYSAGVVIRKVEGGQGQFEGASGYITSNFIVTEDGEMTDYHFGVIFLPRE